MYATRSIWSQPHASHQRHICIVTETYPPEVHGVALTLAHLVEGLRAQGHVVSIVRPRQQPSDGPSDDPTGTLVPGLSIPGYKGVHVGLPVPGLLQGCWMQHRPDVVYVATEGPLGWSAVRTAQRLRIPVFSGFHTNFQMFPCGGLVKPVPWMSWISVAVSPQAPKAMLVVKENTKSSCRFCRGRSWSVTSPAATVTVQVACGGRGTVGVRVYVCRPPLSVKGTVPLSSHII